MMDDDEVTIQIQHQYQPRRAQYQKLLDRDDWLTILVLSLIIMVAAFIGSLAGWITGAMIT